MNNKYKAAWILPFVGFIPFASHLNAQERPNIVFFLVDDYGWADVGYNGSKFYETPNIDRLAAEGMQFTNGYAAAAISSPTRTSIMTGKCPARTQITDWIPGYQHGLTEKQLSRYKMIAPQMVLNMPLEEVTIAEALKEGGYNTYFVGKWHCAEDSSYYPQQQGFDVNIGGWLKGHPTGITRNKGGQGAYYSPYNNPYLTDGPAGEYLTDRLGDESVRLIDKAGNDPFFLYLSFYAVHTPIEGKPELVEYFKNKARKMGIDAIAPFITNMPWLQEREYKANHWKERTIQNDAEYAALIYSMDQNVGKVMDHLKAKGLDRNTIVCFISDNGGLSTAEGSPTCNAPLRGGKGWLYEGGIREPYIIKYPKLVPAKSVCHNPVSSVDFYPTLLELAGLPLLPQQHADGVSLVPFLKKNKKFDRGALYFHYPHYGGKGDTPAGAIRKGDYKLIEFFEDGKVELYNIKKDISETTDLSAKYPKIVTELLSDLRNWRSECDAQMPRHNPGYVKPKQ